MIPYKKMITGTLLSFAVLTAMAIGSPIRSGFIPSIESTRALHVQSSVKESGNEVNPIRRAVDHVVPLIEEDFSGVTEGSEDVPDMSKMLATTEGQPGDERLDYSLTKQHIWRGNRLYAAGGSIALIASENSYDSRPNINTPYGDYSGELTILFKTKPIEENGTAKITINVCHGTLGSPEYANADKSVTSFQLSGTDGWQQYRIDTDNYSANQDGFIQFISDGSILLDDIRIYVSSDKFIASPVQLPCTDFTSDSFTANWDMVRAANTYILGLSRKLYTAESGDDANIDFEGSMLPDGFETSGFHEEGCGSDESKAIKLMNNQFLITPERNAGYKTFSFMMKVNDGGHEESTSLGSLALSFLKNGEWTKYGDFDLLRYKNATTIDMSLLTYGEFAEKQYEAVRFEAQGLPSYCNVVIDDISYTTARPYEMEELFDSEWNGVWLSYPITSYTYSVPNAEGEYFWSVRARRFDKNSEAATTRAFGVAAPEPLPPSDIDITNGTFVANWHKANNATSYRLNVTSTHTAESDETMYPLLSEDFSKVTEDVTSSIDPKQPTPVFNNYGTSSLDKYTKTPGWTGQCTSLSQGYLGCQKKTYYTCMVSTPDINFANGTSFHIALKAVGTSASVLKVMFAGKEESITFNSDGLIDGIFDYELPSTGIYKIRFEDKEGNGFVLDEITISQDLKEGQSVNKTFFTVDIDAPSTSYKVSDVDFQSGIISYTITSYWTDRNETAISTPSAETIVNGADTQLRDISKIDSITSESEVFIDAIYSVDGFKVLQPKNGIYIIRYKDGTSKRVFIK